MLAEIAEQLGITPELLIEPGTILGVERWNRLLGRPRGVAHKPNRTVRVGRWRRTGPKDLVLGFVL